MKTISYSEKDTEAFGEKLAGTLVANSVIALYGELGAGKTAFVRGLGRGLGVLAPVTSPTFAIVNEYSGTLPLFHFDMYRLESADELFDIGWDDYIQRGGVCAVEWSENVEEAFESGTIKVSIKKLDGEKREITAEII